MLERLSAVGRQFRNGESHPTSGRRISDLCCFIRYNARSAVSRYAISAEMLLIKSL
jgi:hypothetical protein